MAAVDMRLACDMHKHCIVIESPCLVRQVGSSSYRYDASDCRGRYIQEGEVSPVEEHVVYNVSSPSPT